jgi:hypothetical protein
MKWLKLPTFSDRFIPRLRFRINFGKNGLGRNLGDFFHCLIWSPCPPTCTSFETKSIVLIALRSATCSVSCEEICMKTFFVHYFAQSHFGHVDDFRRRRKIIFLIVFRFSFKILFLKMTISSHFAVHWSFWTVSLPVDWGRFETILFETFFFGKLCLFVLY